ncbi:hypothetical protein STEG23_030296 [Scotinomys teguina]
MTVTPLGWDQDCSLKIREPDVPAPWFLDPGGWSKTTAVRLFFIFPGICTLSLQREKQLLQQSQTETLKPKVPISLFPLNQSSQVFYYNRKRVKQVTERCARMLEQVSTQNSVLHHLANVSAPLESAKPSSPYPNLPCSSIFPTRRNGPSSMQKYIQQHKEQDITESSPPPKPRPKHCNVDKAEENDLKNSVMKMTEEDFEGKIKSNFKEIEEKTNKKLEEMNKEIEEKNFKNGRNE